MPSPAAVFGRIRRTPARELLTMAHALGVLAVVELLIRSVPLPRLSSVLGVRLDLSEDMAQSTPMSMVDLPPSAQRGLRSTERVTRLWPFCSGPCLRRALVGAHLIRDLDPALRIGVARDGDAGIFAHAWLEIDHAPLEDVGAFTSFEQSQVTRVGGAAS